MTLTAVDCQGFAGGFTLGVVQAGFKLIAKREMRGGFGVRNCEANRHLLGDTWDVQSVDPADWTVPAVKPDLVFGNPPCSGFSQLSVKGFRGVDSRVNTCMWAFVDYAARCQPRIAVFESVQGAYLEGRPLMRALRARLEERTGEPWTLYHVLHNALSVGGPAMRRRYFWVASRVPFGVDVPAALERVPTLEDVIGDLRDMDWNRWPAQAYAHGPTWYSGQFRNVNGEVDGHAVVDNPHTRRARELLNGTEWYPGEYSQIVTRRYFDENGDLPPGWQHLVDKLKGQDFFQGYNTPTMWRPNQPARVITGAGLLNGVHWAEKRTFTHREVARILGFPDNWLIEPLRGAPGLFTTWGKGITVHCGRWIADWAARAITGAPGEHTGEQVGDDEYTINVTEAWRGLCGTVNTKPKLGRKDPVTETAEATPARAGRPRPTETIERDQKVFDYLGEPLTKAELVKRLTENEPDGGWKPTIVYLSLYRLRADGRVKRERGEGGAHVWSRAA